MAEKASVADRNAVGAVPCASLPLDHDPRYEEQLRNDQRCEMGGVLGGGGRNAEPRRRLCWPVIYRTFLLLIVQRRGRCNLPLPRRCAGGERGGASRD